jgi:hypothetical protein
MRRTCADVTEEQTNNASNRFQLTDSSFYYSTAFVVKKNEELPFFSARAVLTMHRVSQSFFPGFGSTLIAVAAHQETINIGTPWVSPSRAIYGLVLFLGPSLMICWKDSMQVN